MCSWRETAAQFLLLPPNLGRAMQAKFAGFRRACKLFFWIQAYNIRWSDWSTRTSRWTGAVPSSSTINPASIGERDSQVPIDGVDAD